MSAPRFILDADFLSAFLKIDRLLLIKDFYKAESVLIPPSVYREVSLTSLLQKLVGISWLRVEAPEPISSQSSPWRPALMIWEPVRGRRSLWHA